MTVLDRDAVAWILGAESSAEFYAEHHGRRWFHAQPGSPDRFGELLSVADLDEVLGRFGLRHPAIKLVRAGDPVPASEYVWRDRMVDPARVAALFAEGATIVFGGLHDHHEPTRRLCSAVSKQVSARTQTNIYLTPPGSQGFRPHWDTHDVFVLQVEGSKRWRIYAGGPELPLKGHKFDPKIHEAGDVECEFTLCRGEALYVPRGQMHAASTTEETSVHITLGVMSYTWADLMTDVLSEVVDRSAAWRENVPTGFAVDPGETDALRAELARRVATLAGEMDLPAVVTARADAFADQVRPRVVDHLRQAGFAASVAEEDQVKWRPGFPGRVEDRDARVAVVCRGREVEFPGAAKATLQRLLTGATFTAGELGDGLDWPSCAVVLRALVREGWVAVSGRC